MANDTERFERTLEQIVQNKAGFITMSNLELTDHDVGRVVRALSKNTTVCNLNLLDNPFSESAVAMLEEVIIEGRHPTLTRAMGVSDKLNRHCRRKQNQLQSLGESEAELQAMSPKQLWETAQAIPALRYWDLREQADSFELFLKKLPRVDFQTPVTLDSLFEADAQGRRPIDNPLTWFEFDKVMDALSQNGITLQKDTLLESDGKTPTPFFEAAFERNMAAKLFTEKNWKGASAKDMRDCYRALPENEKSTISVEALTIRLQQAWKKRNTPVSERG